MKENELTVLDEKQIPFELSISQISIGDIEKDQELDITNNFMSEIPRLSSFDSTSNDHFLDTFISLSPEIKRFVSISSAIMVVKSFLIVFLMFKIDFLISNKIIKNFFLRISWLKEISIFLYFFIGVVMIFSVILISSNEGIITERFLKISILLQILFMPFLPRLEIWQLRTYFLNFLYIGILTTDSVIWMAVSKSKNLQAREILCKSFMANLFVSYSCFGFFEANFCFKIFLNLLISSSIAAFLGAYQVFRYEINLEKKSKITIKDCYFESCVSGFLAFRFTFKKITRCLIGKK